MIAIEFNFPAGRFHATPWGKNVQEGVVEWPPSPWRILRALIALWYRERDNGKMDETLFSEIINKLSTPPEFHLPPATVEHTRHYMPLSGIEEKQKIFDSFALIDRQEKLNVVWRDAHFSEQETKALDLLLSRLSYFGRAESWVEARRIENIDRDANCKPVKEGESVPEGFEGVRVLACVPPANYLEWRQNEVVLKSVRLTKVGQKMKDEQNLLPADLFRALQLETSEIQAAGWSQPPGSTWVTYARPRNCFETKPVGRGSEIKKPPTMARFMIQSKVPPSITRAVSLAERIHQTLVKISDNARVLTGCDEHEMPLKGHEHAHIFCECNPRPGRSSRGEITHIVVSAPKGFDRNALFALGRICKVWGYGGHDIQLILLGIGKPEDFSGNPDDGYCSLFAESKKWVSLTPFVPTRHPKVTRAGIHKVDGNRYQIGGPEHDLLRLLELQGKPKPLKISRVPVTKTTGRAIRWLQFILERKHGGGARGDNRGYGFEIEFSEPVKGPIAVGYGSHFGLGLFVPAAKEEK